MPPGGAGDKRVLAGEIEHHRRLHQRFDLGRGADRTRRQFAVDALDQPGEHAAGADLDDLLDLVLLEQQHGLAPAHHAGHLLDEQLADFVGIAGRRGGDVGDDRDARRLQRHLAERLLP